MQRVVGDLLSRKRVDERGFIERRWGLCTSECGWEDWGVVGEISKEHPFYVVRGAIGGGRWHDSSLSDRLWRDYRRGSSARRPRRNMKSFIEYNKASTVSVEGGGAGARRGVKAPQSNPRKAPQSVYICGRKPNPSRAPISSISPNHPACPGKPSARPRAHPHRSARCPAPPARRATARLKKSARRAQHMRTPLIENSLRSPQPSDRLRGQRGKKSDIGGRGAREARLAAIL